MKTRWILTVAMLALVVAGCADPTTSDEYLQLSDRLAETEADLADSQASVDELTSGLSASEARVAEVEAELAETQAAADEEQAAAADREAELEGELDEWQAFAGTAGLRQWSPAYRELVMANCTGGPDPWTEEVCSCLADWMEARMSLEEILYTSEADTAAFVGSVPVDQFTGFVEGFPDELAGRLTEMVLNCT